MPSNTKIWFLLAGVLWLSAAALLTLGFLKPSLSMLRWAGAADAVWALVFTVIALRRLNR
jgi:hypothetical protein